MVIKIKKKESAKGMAEKINKIAAKSKKINWDKYFGKIDFPVEPLAYQKKSRNEWSD